MRNGIRALMITASMATCGWVGFIGGMVYEETNGGFSQIQKVLYMDSGPRQQAAIRYLCMNDRRARQVLVAEGICIVRDLESEKNI